MEKFEKNKNVYTKNPANIAGLSESYLYNFNPFKFIEILLLLFKILPNLHITIIH